MKKRSWLLLISVFLVIVLACTLSMNVTTRQGIDYKVSSIKIPLYLKIVGFIDRHYNYKQLAQRIIGNERDEQKKVMKIFSWAHHNIKRQPETLPVIDDHVWHIIVRGYGMSDQSCDVFATLCNYAGIDAVFLRVHAYEGKREIWLSFAKINGRWVTFDPYRGVYFRDNDGVLADIKTLQSEVFTMETVDKGPDIDYIPYFVNLPSLSNIGLSRSSVQSPLKRLLYLIKKGS